MPNPYIIVISCVTTETVMVSSPYIFYKADEVHLFRYIRDPGSERGDLYDDHYREACNQILRSLPSCRIMEHREEPVYDFTALAHGLGRMYSHIFREHPDAEVYANLSSGLSEFAATLGIFAFLNPGIKLFKVSTKTFTLDSQEYRRLCYDGDVPVGLSREVYPPKIIPSGGLCRPDEILVRSLRVYDQLLSQGKKPTGPIIQRELEKKELWVSNRRDPGKLDGRTLDTVRRMMRHSSIEITLESYVRADPRKMKTATNSIDDALFG